MMYDVTKSSAVGKAQSSPIFIIGYGNAYRRDDGAGVVLAEMLADHWATYGRCAEVITSTQLKPEMAEEIYQRESQAVVFVDCKYADGNSNDDKIDEGAGHDGHNGIRIAPIELKTATPALGHHLDPATVLIYARILYDCRPRAWLVTITGQDFKHGEGFSQKVDECLSDISAPARQLLAEIEEAISCMS